MIVLRQLGQVPATLPTFMPPTISQPTRYEAWAALGSGLLAAASLTLFALGHDKAGYMLGIGSAIGGAAVAAARIVGEGT